MLCLLAIIDVMKEFLFGQMARILIVAGFGLVLLFPLEMCGLACLFLISGFENGTLVE